MEKNLITIKTPKCFVCGKGSMVTLNAEKAKKWLEGMFIQDAFPDMTKAERELLISGTHEECWNTLFAKENK